LPVLGGIYLYWINGDMHILIAYRDRVCRGMVLINHFGSGLGQILRKMEIRTKQISHNKLYSSYMKNISLSYFLVWGAMGRWFESSPPDFI
jgi:hypothetical protein